MGQLGYVLSKERLQDRRKRTRYYKQDLKLMTTHQLREICRRILFLIMWMKILSSLRMESKNTSYVSESMSLRRFVKCIPMNITL